MPKVKRWGLVFFGVELFEVFHKPEYAQTEADKRNRKIDDRNVWTIEPVTVTWAKSAPVKGKGRKR
jgi:hypothetical protein